MSSIDPSSTQADYEALKELEADSAELERLETQLDRFNVFENIVGFDKNEEMHSNILASLLDPKRTGLLGELLIREVLRETLDAGRGTILPSRIGDLGRLRESLDHIDLGNTLIRREHYRVDVLLTNEDHKIAVIIENKIRAGEGPTQLDWYDRIIRHTHPGWYVHRIFLTPSGVAPSHRAYVPMTYGALCDIIDRVSESGGSALDPNARVPAQHYARMVRRKILGDPDIVIASQRLYEKHKRAFDFVYSHLPDVRAQIQEMVMSLVTRETRLELDKHEKGNIKFGIRGWDTPALTIPEDFPQQWTPSRRMLLFQITNAKKELNLHLFLGPGPKEIRQGLLETVRRDEPSVFVMPRAVGTWVPIYHRPILGPEGYDKLTRQEREVAIRRHWDEFLNLDLPRMDKVLMREKWTQEPDQRSDPT